MRKKSYFTFLLGIVVFFGFASHVFGINGRDVDGKISATLSYGHVQDPSFKAARSNSVTVTIDGEYMEKVLLLLGKTEEGFMKTVSGTLVSDKNTGSVDLVLHLENNKRSKSTDGDLLPSCDCYDEKAKKTKHYDGSLKMSKEVMCHHYCCKVDKKYGYQWGGNIDPSAALLKCGS